MIFSDKRFLSKRRVQGRVGMGPSLWKIIETYEEQLLRDPLKAREELILLFKGFLHEERVFEAQVIWPLVVKAIIFSWDDFSLLDEYLAWIKENPLPETFSLVPDLEAAALSAYLGCLLFRRPETPELPRLEEKLFSLVRLCQREITRFDGLFFLAVYAFWQGNLQRLHQIIDELGRKNEKRSPAGALLASWMRAGRDIWIHVDLVSAQEELERGSLLAEREGISLWNHVLWAMKIACHLFKGEIKEADQALSLMEKTLRGGRHRRYHYFYLLGWKAFLEEDFNAAELALRRAAEIAEETGYFYSYYLSQLALSQVLFRKGHLPETLSLLALTEEFARRVKSRLLFFMCLLFRAQLAYLAGDRAFGRFYLSRALGMGNRENYFQFLWWSNPSMMAFLCAKALEEGIEQAYVQRYIIKHRLRPPEKRPPHRDWPYPVRIHTLGRLEILVEGKPLRWSRKSPERPLALLLALVTSGGTIDRERLLDLFWPEFEADSAYHALESALYRLRNLLGLREVIVSKGHRLHFQEEMVFVDLWFLKERLNDLEKALSEGKMLSAYFLVEEILELYAEFLPGLEYSFVVFEREALKSRVFSLLKRIAGPLKEEFPEKARFLLERIWLLDPTDEELFSPFFDFLAESTPETALSLYQRFVTLLEAQGKKVSYALSAKAQKLKEALAS